MYIRVIQSDKTGHGVRHVSGPGGRDCRQVSVQIGIGTISGQVPSDSGRSIAEVYGDILELSRLAESAGFDSIWVSEHHGTADSHLPSPIVMLAAIAAVTDRIQLGSGIAVAPFQHPIRFAEDCAVVDQLSRGRLIVGLGPGWRDEEFVAFGVPTTERIRRTLELAAFCRAAWADGHAPSGESLGPGRDVTISPRPRGRLPLLLGGGVPAATARAGRVADGFIAPPLSHLDAFRTLVDAFDQAARDAGRDPLSMAIGFQVNVWVSPDGAVPEVVRRAMWHKIGTSMRWHAGERVETVDDLPPLDETVLARRAIVGTPANVTATLQPWIAAFADRDLHVLVRFQHAGLPLDVVAPAVRLFAAEVSPALRSAGAAISVGPG